MAWVLSNIGVLRESMGDYARAQRDLEESLQIREKAPGPHQRDVAISLGNLGSLYKDEGDYARAESFLQRALSIRQTLGEGHLDVAASQSQLASLYFVEGDLARAEPALESALSIREAALGAVHPSVAVSLNNLATLKREQGQYDEAERLYERALEINEKAFGPGHPDVAVTLFNIAGNALARGDLAAARSALAKGLDVRERHVVQTIVSGSEQQRRLFLATSTDDLDQTVSFHAQNERSDPEAARLALLAILRRKGRVLDATAETGRTLWAHLDAAEQEKLVKLRGIRARIAQSAEDPPTSETARQAVAQMSATADATESELSAQSAAFRVQAQPVTVESVARAIPDDAVLVDIVRYRPYDARAPWPKRWSAAARYAAYALRRDAGIAYADLGEADSIDARVKSFDGALARGSDVVNALARELDERVGRPLRTLVGDAHRVLLAPDGQLNVLPFAALLDERGEYLVGRYEFTYLTSGRDLLGLERGGGAVTSAPAVVADPDFGPRGPPRLEGTRDEARLVLAHFPGARVLMGRDATKDAVLNLRSPRVLHIATHGFFEPRPEPSTKAPARRLAVEWKTPGSLSALPDNPLLHSGLRLAEPNVSADEGRLTALEASGLDLWGTKLVVLSTCDSGAGEVSSDGEGVYGLRRALLLAGASSVVMSLWKLDDRAVPALMGKYYDALAKGEGRSEALRTAQLAMLAEPASRHPYFWATFIPAGDWRSLDGAEAPVRSGPAPSDFARVHPGACGCGIPGLAEGAPGSSVVVLGVFAWLVRRRRGCERVAGAAIHT